MTDEQLRAAQDAAVEAAGHRQLEPHPAGLPGRIKDADAAADAALAEGEQDGLNPFWPKGLRSSSLSNTDNQRINAPTFSGRSS